MRYFKGKQFKKDIILVAVGYMSMELEKENQQGPLCLAFR